MENMTWIQRKTANQMCPAFYYTADIRGSFLILRKTLQHIINKLKKTKFKYCTMVQHDIVFSFSQIINIKRHFHFNRLFSHITVCAVSPKLYFSTSIYSMSLFWFFFSVCLCVCGLSYCTFVTLHSSMSATIQLHPVPSIFLLATSELVDNWPVADLEWSVNLLSIIKVTEHCFMHSASCFYNRWWLWFQSNDMLLLYLPSQSIQLGTNYTKTKYTILKPRLNSPHIIFPFTVTYRDLFYVYLPGV